jgi:protein-disulfide isomerase
VEFGRRVELGRPPALLTAGLSFLVLAGVLAFAETQHQAAVAASNERQIQATLAALPTPDPASGSPEPTALSFWEPYRLGPEKADVRLILFNDFECEFCRMARTEAKGLVSKYPGRVSLSIKHWPLCRKCNWLVKTRHPHACRAAQAAEAGGILKGTDGFWRMCDWLGQRLGKFNEKELRAALPDLGFADQERFINTMTTEGLQRVRDDIGEAEVFHPDNVPTILINGVQLKGWAPGTPLEPVIKLALEKTTPSTAKKTTTDHTDFTDK